jgi:cell division protein FtsZ
MVHRIQNRNPGYSDFSNLSSNTTFNFSTSNTAPVSHGANALKLENEVVSENIKHNESVDEVNNQYHEELLKNQEAENIVENTSKEHEMSFSEEAISTPEPAQEIPNDLKEFGVDANEPDLFNSDSEISSTENLLGTQEEEEDDLEIPAFLRRQKN